MRNTAAVVAALLLPAVKDLSTYHLVHKWGGVTLDNRATTAVNIPPERRSFVLLFLVLCHLSTHPSIDPSMP